MSPITKVFFFLGPFKTLCPVLNLKAIFWGASLSLLMKE